MGNCIDKFISNRLDKRINEREQLIDYFDSGCYEKDFANIIELRNIANELTNNCNIFLERISEQYSKLN